MRVYRHLSSRLLRVLPLTLLATPAAFAGDIVPVVNTMNESVTVYWTAAGCAGIKNGKTFVCDSKELAPGQSDSYTFRKGTTAQKVAASGPSACYGKDAVKVGSGVSIEKDCSMQVVDAPTAADCANLTVTGPERALPRKLVNFTNSYPAAECAKMPIFEYRAKAANGLDKVFMATPLPTAPWTTPHEEGEYEILVQGQVKNGQGMFGRTTLHVTSSPCLDFALEALDSQGRLLSEKVGIEPGEKLALRIKAKRCDRPLIAYQFIVAGPDGKTQSLSGSDHTMDTVVLQAPTVRGKYTFTVQARSDRLVQAPRSTTISVAGSNCAKVALRADAGGLKAVTQGCKPGYFTFTGNGNRGIQKVLCSGASDTCSAAVPATIASVTLDVYEAEGQAHLGTANISVK